MENTVMQSPVMDTTGRKLAARQRAQGEIEPKHGAPPVTRTWGTLLHQEEDGLATAEYGIVMLAAVGFAGLLVAVLSSGTARGLLTGIVERALSF